MNPRIADIYIRITNESPMKNAIAILPMIAFMACTHQFEYDEGGAALVKYHATPYVTEFSYKVTESDTLQMALETDIIFASYESREGGIIVNIKVEHAK